jgi:superfamily I DNA/RNA helicase
VARLAISKGFLADYAKLGKDVQRAVDQAVATFARDPHPGRTLERPRHIKDNRLRIMPVDSNWRGVVLAPEARDPEARDAKDADTYCLVTVLPRDKALAYASSHRFSVNAALGVLEVRNDKALSQFQPTLEAATEPESCLFADVTDADLSRLGVDTQVLSAVRLVASESDLEALESAIPEAQYAALHALASGMTIDETLDEVIRLSAGDGTSPGDVDPDDLVAAMERAPGQITFVSGPEELQHVLSYPFAAWRTFLHPNQRQIACRPSYAGPAQVTGGPGTGKTVTLLHRAAFLAAQAKEADQPERAHQGEPILVTTFAGNLADALQSQLALLIRDPKIRQQIEVLNVDRLAYRIVKQSRGTPVITDERTLRARWAQAAAQAGLNLTPAFGKNEWEQVILAQDLHTEEAYLSCQRTGRGRPLSKTQRSLIWQAAQQVTAELAAAGQTTHLQLANEATHLLRMAKRPPYAHILVDEAQDLHPSQWRLLRAAVAPGQNDLFISADPHQRVYDNRVSLSSLDINVRGRSRRLSLNYRTTQEILAWAVPLLGTEPVTGLDGEVDTLLGYQSPMHGPRPQQKVAVSRAEEFSLLTERIGSWLAAGIEPHAIGVAARSASLIREAREALKTARIPTVSLNGRGSSKSVRAGTMHAMKGLEFQAVAVIGVEQGLVPDPAAVTPESEDRAVHNQDLQRERCVLFVACTRARDHLYVSATADPSEFLLPHIAAAPSLLDPEPAPSPLDPEPAPSPAAAPSPSGSVAPAPSAPDAAREPITTAPPLQPAAAGPLATGAEVRDGQLTILNRAPVDGLTAALYLARAPWRPPVIVQVPRDGVVKLPPEAYEGGPLRVLLRVEDLDAVTDWPDWPGRDSFACTAPGIPLGADLEEEALSRFLAGQRDLPMRPRRVDRLWLLIDLAADLIAAGAPADLRDRCSAVLRTQPGLAIIGLLDADLDAAACVSALISTGLAAARPVMLDDMRSAERLWSAAPAAAAVLCSRLLAGPPYPDEDPAAVVMKAAQAQCGPALAALLRGDGDPHPQSAQFGPDTERMALFAASLEAAAVPHSLLDAATRAAAARQLFEARRHPDLARAVPDAPSVIRSAERLVASSPYRYARTHITARLHPDGSGGWLALPAMSASLALIARIAARGNEDCRAFERTWRPRWIALARQAPALTTIDMVLAEALIASAERARFAKKRS